MKRILMIGLVWLMLSGFTSPAIPAVRQLNSPQPQTYTVLVGLENAKKGTEFNAYFPDTLHIHPGDTVKFMQNSHEIHTVTFLASTPEPALLIPVNPADPTGPQMLNPLAAFPFAPSNGMYDGSTYASSGVMSLDPGQPTEFDLTFTKVGSYPFLCLVHGEMMSGTIVVDDPSVSVPSPVKVRTMVEQLVEQAKAAVRDVYKSARSDLVPAEQNPDGTTTYTITMGGAQGYVDLAAFFPNKLVVHPGDTVNFVMAATNGAPHTVTFLNGAADIPFFVAVPQPAGPPLLEINPDFAKPYQPGQPLTRNGIFSSGLMIPGVPGMGMYSITIGNIQGPIEFECMIHDTAGMHGILYVTPRSQ